MADSSVSSSTWRDAALVILGHGSTQNPDSSTPTWQHADELRRRGLFREVQCAFWKEEPGFREVMHMIDSDHVFVVPNFISEGYFTRDVGLIRASGAGFGEVVDAYMEEEPLVARWDELTTAPNVVVVPFFIADGLHSYEDIPVLLGLTENSPGAISANQGEVFRRNPYALRGRQLFYSAAIGTDELMADVIMDQVAAAPQESTSPAA